MGFDISAGHLCETGLVRKENQDAFFEHISSSISVFCVADGMGGHANGKRASNAITIGIREWVDGFYAEKYKLGFLEILDDFEKKLSAVNQQIFRFYNVGQTCGSTLAVLLIYEKYYAVLSMGDSRVYRKRGFSFVQLTKDDTWQNSDQVPVGISNIDIKKHSNYDKLVRALGTQESFIPHGQTDQLKVGDMFLLCSDGIYKYCDKKVLEKIVGRQLWKTGETLEERLQQLQVSVIGRGAPDNYTAILVSVK